MQFFLFFPQKNTPVTKHRGVGHGDVTSVPVAIQKKTYSQIKQSGTLVTSPCPTFYYLNIQFYAYLGFRFLLVLLYLVGSDLGKVAYGGYSEAS